MKTLLVVGIIIVLSAEQISVSALGLLLMLWPVINFNEDWI